MGLLNKSTPSADQQFNPRFMRMYQYAVDAQVAALEDRKKKKEIGKLESKLKDPKSELNKNQKKLLKQLLLQDVITETAQPAPMVRGKHDFVNY